MPSCEKEVQSIAKTLDKMLGGRKETPDALNLLRALEKLPITHEIVSKTRINVTVDELRRKTDDEKLSRRARALIRGWQDLSADSRPSFISDRTRRSPDEDRKPSKAELNDRSGDRRAPPINRRTDERRRKDFNREVKREGEEEAKRIDKKPDKPEDEPEERELPNFEPSGKLTAETNTYKGVVVKYNEPPEAKKARSRWRIYPFKGTEQLPIIYVHRQSAYLIGRERKIADFPVDHPSCSKQHAVLQYRSMPYQRPDGTHARRTLPYIIDLGSGNGTYLNDERIEPQRYYELKEQDVLKFGFSSREYVLLKELPEEERNQNDDDRDPDEDDIDIIDRAGLEEREEEEEKTDVY